ncbi:MAG: hypothetical protein QOH36_955, partial [Actinomycetota bacterium]|nr:hypothetical protein [Actinomycetota bacterium]
MIVCGNCEYRNPDANTFCDSCGDYLMWSGTVVPERTAEPEPGPARRVEREAEPAPDAGAQDDAGAGAEPDAGPGAEPDAGPERAPAPRPAARATPPSRPAPSPRPPPPSRP